MPVLKLDPTPNVPDEQPSTAADIRAICDELADMLVAKNAAYGDSALSPMRVFSRADPIEQIKVRLDDKLSRLSRSTEYPGDDTVLDLMGYLVLLRIATRREAVAAATRAVRP